MACTALLSSKWFITSSIVLYINIQQGVCITSPKKLKCVGLFFGSVSLLWVDTLTHSGFKDYGAYWRYNYETIEEDVQYKYTGDQLMEDVRSLYKEVRQ